MNDRCDVCGKFIGSHNIIFCECCDNSCCPSCIAEEGSEYGGEFPDETSWDMCEKCENKKSEIKGEK